MEERSLRQNISSPPKLSLPILIFFKLTLVALPVAQISIGGVYLKACESQPLIPVYLLVSGVFSTVLGLFSCLPFIQRCSQTLLGSVGTSWNYLLSLFLFCWFICGNVWIYSIYQPSYDSAHRPYCDKTLYLFAFWSTTLVYVVLGLVLVVGFCVCLCGRPGVNTRAEDV